MHKIKKIVVFTGNINYSVRKGLISIDRDMDGPSWLILLHAPSHSFSRVLRNQWHNLKYHGWRRIPDIAVSAYFRIRPFANPRIPPSAPGMEYTLDRIRELPNFRFVKFKNISSKNAMKEIIRFEPDLGLSLSSPVLRNGIFKIPRFGTLNLHKGKVPEYRGMPPAFWEMWNGEKDVGCTVHWVDERLDTGAVVQLSQVERQKYSTVKGLQLTLDELGADLMRDAVLKVDQGMELCIPQRPGGRTYRQPTLKQIFQLKQKINASMPASAPTLKKAPKDAVKIMAFFFHKLLVQRLASPRITILLYHRVTDDARDNLTTGIEQFDRQMALLRHHFLPIPITELLKIDSVPASNRPLVCVTFDDGYLDNFVNAVPILLRHNMPASFFVATGLIGTKKQFPHDIRRGNQPIPMMEWSHLREMHRAGFAIGSHTVNHIDCAAESAQVVYDELCQSMDEIRSRIGINDVIFAYPYGGKKNMTDERLEMVRQVGYVGCLSAYGGSNIGKIDRFDILRRGIHWEFSDASFLHAALGL